MHEPQLPQRKLHIGWIAAGVCLLLVALFCFQLLGPNPAIIVSQETTFITEPIGPNGLPDYEQYWYQQASAGVTPENNAALLIWEAMWPGELSQEHWLPLCEALGMETVPSTKEALIDPDDESVNEQLALDLAKRFSENATAENNDEDYFSEDWQSRLATGLKYQITEEANSRPWTSEQFPALARWVEQNQKPLNLLVEASRRPRYFSPSPTMLDNSDQMLIAMLLPDIQMMRTAARALSLRAMWHLGEGRTMEAWQDLLACHRLARLTAENNTLVGQLVAIAIDGIASEGTELLLHHGNLSAADARQILAELNGLGPSSCCVRAMDQGERLWFLDVVLNFAGGNSDAAESLGIANEPVQALNLARIDWNAVLRMVNYWSDRLVAAARLPQRDQRIAELEQIELELNQVVNGTRTPSALLGSLFSKSRRSEVVGNVLLGLLLPATRAVFNAEDRSQVQLELTKLAAALAIYRAEQEEYPEQLSDLVPAVLRKMPIDRYSGQPFLYQRKDDRGYLLYSVFENEIDDGGTDISGEIIAGEWVDRRADDFDYAESDIVIRVPVPAFKLPSPPSVEDFEYGHYGE